MGRLDGAISGVKTGGKLGSFAGPKGAAIGSALGGIGGFLLGGDEDSEESRQKALADFLRMQGLESTVPMVQQPQLGAFNATGGLLG